MARTRVGTSHVSKKKISDESGKRTRPKKRYSRSMFIVLFVILAIVVLLLLFEVGILPKPVLWRQPVELAAADRCSLIAGKLIHTLNDEDACHVQCFAECETYKHTLINSTFVSRADDCHLCTCLCK